MKQTMLFLMLALAVQAMGQGIATPNQTMVRRAVEPTLWVVRSGYKLQDTTGQYYGRSGRDEYSQGFTLSVGVDGSLLSMGMVATPWERDDSFDRYRQTHTPVLSSLACRHLSDSLYTTIPLPAETVQGQFLTLGLAEGSLNRHVGSASDGWLLWVYVADTLDHVGTTHTEAVSYSIRPDETATQRRVSPPRIPLGVRSSEARCRAIGAVWVVPTYPGEGIVRFCLGGIAVPDEGGWNLTLFPITPADELTPSTNPSQNKSDKKKKRR